MLDFGVDDVGDGIVAEVDLDSCQYKRFMGNRCGQTVPYHRLS